MRALAIILNLVVIVGIVLLIANDGMQGAKLWVTALIFFFPVVNIAALLPTGKLLQRERLRAEAAEAKCRKVQELEEKLYPSVERAFLEAASFRDKVREFLDGLEGDSETDKLLVPTSEIRKLADALGDVPPSGVDFAANIVKSRVCPRVPRPLRIIHAAGRAPTMAPTRIVIACFVIISVSLGIAQDPVQPQAEVNVVERFEGGGKGLVRLLAEGSTGSLTGRWAGRTRAFARPSEPTIFSYSWNVPTSSYQESISLMW